jgi:hypothetical protein
MLSFSAAALFFQVSITIGRDAKSDSARDARRDSAIVVRDSVQRAREEREPRRIAVTAEHLATAFASPGARELLTRARQQRLSHDSTLESYDAKSYQRMSAGIGLTKWGRERLMFRHEDAARVRWARGRGVRVDVTGSRTVVPVAKDADAKAEGADLYAVPYTPGQEQLWVGGGLAKREVNEREIVHPIAEGAEAYYRYSLGDSVSMRLPDGTVIRLQELRVEARRPRWNLIVGSLWFDTKSAQLVRAAYRPSIPIDIVMLAEEEAREDGEDDDDIPRWLRPMTATVQAITVEYGLQQGAGGGFWWLPRFQYAEGEAQVSLMRIPFRVEQRFQYQSVNGTVEMPEIPPSAVQDTLAYADTLTLSDSARAEIRRRYAEGYDGRDDKVYVSRRRGRVPMVVSVPKDSIALERSSDLPPSIYDENDALLSRKDADELVSSLGFDLQAGWDPQAPTLHYGLEQGLARYNRVEGLSLGVAADQLLGRGYTARATARIGVADWEPNAELSLSRSDGRRTISLTAYRRLTSASDWGDPFTVGASASALLFGREEGFYYRALGAELTGTFARASGLTWRLFAERQQNAPKRTDISLPNAINGLEFRDNLRTMRADVAGASLRLRTAHGTDPRGWRLFTDARLEGAAGGFDYGRGAVDMTVTHALGEHLDGALTLGGGATAGDVPTQRLWYLGGVQTVRGQPASAMADNAVGNAYWLGRAELGSSFNAARPVVFFDIGWAGDRSMWSDARQQPISGAGIGASFLDGLLRLDLSKGIRPTRGWRTDFYLEARF